MNILLWVLQVVVALFCVAGAAWRVANWEEATKVASVAALPKAAWIAIGIFEIACGAGLLLYKVKPSLTPLAAGALVVEMLLLSGLHLKYFGFQVAPTNPAMWTVGLAVLSAFIAYGRMGQ